MADDDQEPERENKDALSDWVDDMRSSVIRTVPPERRASTIRNFLTYTMERLPSWAGWGLRLLVLGLIGLWLVLFVAPRY